MIGITRAVVLAALGASVAGAFKVQEEATPPTEQRRPDSVPGAGVRHSQANAAGVRDPLEEVRILIHEGHYAEAERAARTLLAETEVRNGRESTEAADVLDVLVEALIRGGKASDPETLTFADRVVATKEKLLGPNDPVLSRSLDNLALLHYLNGDFSKSLTAADRALTLGEKALGPSHPDVAQSLNVLAMLRRDTGDYVAARKLAERALRIRETTVGPDDTAVAESEDVLGSVLMNMGEYAGARALHERAVAIREKSLGPDHPDVAKSLNNLANVVDIMGDSARARKLFERACAIWARSLGPDHPLVAACSLNLGVVLQEMGDYVGARRVYERALAVWEKVLGPDHPDVGLALNNLGIILAYTGDFGEAKALFERAVTIREKALGPNHPDVAQSLSCLGSVLCDSGSCAAARPLSERVLAIREKSLGPDHPEVADALLNLGEVLWKTGDNRGAEPLYSRALAIYEKSLGSEHPSVAGAHQSLADLLAGRGDLAAAKQHCELALAIREKALGADHPDVAKTLISLAKLQEQAGNTSKAFAAALQAETNLRQHFQITARTLAERQALAYASERSSGLDLALSLVSGQADKSGHYERSGWDALIRSRALVLDEMAERHHVTADADDAEIARLAEELASARERLANLAVHGLGDLAPDRYRSMLDKTRQEEEQAERALAEKSVPFREERGKRRLGIDDVLKALPSDSALVAFSRYGQYEFGLKPAGKPLEPIPSYLAFVSRSGVKEPEVVPLGTAKEIDGLISHWRGQIALEAIAPGQAPKRAETNYRAAATGLRRKIWDPLVPYVRGARYVFVVPDGALNLVNLAALPTGETSYLIERGPLIHYLSAERDLVTTDSRAKNVGLLAVGAPAFDETKLFADLAPEKGKLETNLPAQRAPLRTYRGNRSACGEFQSMRFEPLPASAREAGEVIALWNMSSSMRQNKTRALRGSIQASPHLSVYLRGEAASETAFKQQAPGKRVLHLATHGFFLGEHCAPALEAAEKTATDNPVVAAGENPLLLSGLALAGANHRQAARPDEDDGILTAEEIAALDLDGVEWAVLSGCDTGVGEVKAGEGVFGLRRAFQVAGVRTIIMSLWPVEDQATRQWMTALYEGRFMKGLDTAQAVHQASLRLLRQRRVKNQSTHPFYWAGFVAAGDWR